MAIMHQLACRIFGKITTEYRDFSTYRRVSTGIFWATNGHEFSLMPCGGGHGLTRNWKSLSELVRGKQSTECTEKSPRIGTYLLVFFWTTNGHEFTLMPCGAISVSSEEVVGSSEPCGVELSHADGADFRRSMRSKFCVFSWISVSSCVQWFLT